MSREYLIPMANVTVAGSPQSLIYFQPPTAAGNNSSLELLRMFLSQHANATSAQQPVQISTQVSTFPTLTAQTPTKLKQNDPASLLTGGTAGAAGTCGINASAEGAGAKTVMWRDAFNVLNGWLWVPTPPETVIAPANPTTPVGYGIVFPTAPTSTANWNGGLVYREIG